MDKRVVVITGASSGIGEALARKYASEGASLVLGARRLDRLEQLQTELSPAEVVVVAADVSLETDCKMLIETAVQHFGTIDVLINNAGISMRAIFEEVDLTVMRRLMDVNFWGTVYCTKFAMPYLLASKGSVVGIISIAGHIGLPGRSGYSASKFAVRGFLDTLRTENLKTGLHVLLVAPGFTASEVRQSALNALGNAQGDSPRDESKMMSAEAVADYVYDGVTRRKRSLVLTFVEGKLTVLLHKIFPSLVDRLAYNHMAKEPDTPLK